MSQPHVAIERLVKTYPGGQKPAVDHVSFTVPRGEMLALLGPSGCGKTTLLRMIAGLVTPTAGAIRVDGRDVSGLPVYKRNMGMVFQAYALFPHMTVAGNVAFGLEMRGIGRAERDERVKKALDLVKLTGFGERRVSQLSGGQQQRAAIARSLVIEPELLLLDEPLSNLDAKLRDQMRDEIRDIQLRTGVTAIFVTHDQDEALSMADRLAVMSAGNLEQIGTPRDIFDRPATEFVASFIGAGTFFAAKAVEPGVAAVDGLGLLRYDGDAAAGTALKLMVRPHRFRLAEAGAEHGPNRFAGAVEHLVYRGQLATVTVRCGDMALTADLPTHAAALPDKGERVVLEVAPGDITRIGTVA